MSSISNSVFVFVLLGTSLPGCAPELEVGNSVHPVESENALSMNALSMNALSMNALSMNALSMNGLAISTNDFGATPEGRSLLAYVIRCAMPAGVTLTYYNDHDDDDDDEDEADDDGITYSFAGLLGLAPSWNSQALTTVESERISACLMAHVNFFEHPVAISARHPSLAADQDELTRFSSHEGAFFGQLFADPPLMYACTGDAAPDFSVAYPAHDTDAGDRLLRRCTDVDGTTTACGLTNVGPCSTACTALVAGAAGSCYTGPGQTGTLYAEAVAIWLLAHDDAASSWPTAYDTYYGP